MTQSDNEKPVLSIKPQPDGLGFLYGELARGYDSYRVDIMPPIAEWHGQIKLTEQGPHETEWVAYVNGHEIARALSRDDLEPLIMDAIAHS